jgi:hypothetical protein
MSEQWKHLLSPFYLGPIPLYANYSSKTVENAWQFSKVFPGFGDDSGPFSQYFQWAEEHWNSTRAVRYPVSKTAIPLYSWWDGEKLSYIEARKKIYIPLYSKALKDREGIPKLLELYKKYNKLILWDFDGYNCSGSFEEIVNNPNKKMGHAFVIKLCLEEALCTF